MDEIIVIMRLVRACQMCLTLLLNSSSILATIKAAKQYAVFTKFRTSAMLRNASNLSYDIPANIKDEQQREISRLDEAAGTDLVGYLHENEVGRDQSFRGPFGGRKIG